MSNQNRNAADWGIDLNMTPEERAYWDSRGVVGPDLSMRPAVMPYDWREPGTIPTVPAVPIVPIETVDEVVLRGPDGEPWNRTGKGGGLLMLGAAALILFGLLR